MKILLGLEKILLNWKTLETFSTRNMNVKNGSFIVISLLVFISNNTKKFMIQLSNLGNTLNTKVEVVR